MTTKLTIILNAKAGGTDANRTKEVEDALNSLGVDYRLVETGEQHPAEAAAAQAIEQGASSLCACGGDGTVAQVANAILKSGRPELVLSIIPLGTGNLIAQAIGVPKDIRDAAKTIKEEVVRQFDVGRIRDDYFLLGLGMGATERFVTQAGDGAKERLGRLAYAISLLRQTGEPPFKVDISVDGKRIAKLSAEAVTLANFCGNSKLELLKEWSPDDGEMELIISKRLTGWNIVRMAINGLRGQLERDEDIDVIRGVRFEIQTTPSMPVQLDGDDSNLKTPIKIEVIRRAIGVCVPSDA